MSIIDKINNLDRRIIYLLVWVVVLFPLMFPLGLPIPISSDARSWYSYVENNVKEGDTVIFAIMYGTPSMPELLPMTAATMKHLLEKDVKILVLSFESEGPLVFNTLLRRVNPADYGKVYGVDWINLGYIPGGEVAMATLATSFQNSVANDYMEGRPLGSFNIMDNIHTATDIDLIINFNVGVDEWLRQWNTPYGVPMIEGCAGAAVSVMIPYINSGQISALLPGLTVSAEYELLLEKPGLAVAGVDAVSMSQLLIVLLVVIGNIAYFMTKEEEK